MIEMIEVNGDDGKNTVDVLGWRVAISRRVWDRCVAVPKRAKGQTEGDRLHDLLASLGFNLRILAAPSHARQCSSFLFPVNVINDGRRRRDCPDGLKCPGEEIPIEAFASFDRDGHPLLTVLAQSEVFLLLG